MLLTVRNVGVFTIRKMELEENNLLRVHTDDGEEVLLAVVLSVRAKDNYMLAFQERAKPFSVRRLFALGKRKYEYTIETALREHLRDIANANNVDEDQFIHDILAIPTELLNVVIEELVLKNEVSTHTVIHASELLASVNEPFVPYHVLLSLVRVDNE